MSKKTEIKKVLYRFSQDGISSDDAAQQVLDLFSVDPEEVFLRPKTRGDLYDALKKGIKCECVTSNVEFTSLALQSLNAMTYGNVQFKTYPSKNVGWSIYEPVQ